MEIACVINTLVNTGDWHLLTYIPDSKENQLNFFDLVNIYGFAKRLLYEAHTWWTQSFHLSHPPPCFCFSNKPLSFTDLPDLQAYGFTINENTAQKDQTHLQNLHPAFLWWSSTTINSHQLFLIILVGVLSGLCVHLSVYPCHRVRSTVCVQETPAVGAQCVFWSRSSVLSRFLVCDSN